MKLVRLVLVAALTASVGGCLLDTGVPDNSFIADYQFGSGQTPTGWSAGAVDFPAAQEAEVGFIADVRLRPEETLDQAPALYLQGTNVSGDLFMYWYRKVDGFNPNADYTIGLDVEYISNVGRDCSGVSTWIKAGVFNVEPVQSVDQSGWVRLNIDKGQLGLGGATMPTLGDIRNNSLGCIPGGPYALWARHSAQDVIRVTASAAGELWLILGTESGTPGLQDIYFGRFGVRFRPVE